MSTSTTNPTPQNHLRFQNGFLGLTSTTSNLSKYQITLPEVLHTSTLTSILATTFEYDSEWFEGHLPTNIRYDLVIHDEKVGQDGILRKRKDRLGSIIVPSKPPNQKLHCCFHPKVTVLEFMNRDSDEECLRVCISSGNLMKAAWYDVNNHIFIQDFPPRTSLPTLLVNNYTSEFQAYLGFFLRSCSVGDEWMDTIMKYDMGSAVGRLVGSLPSPLTGPRRHLATNYDFDAAAQTGLLRLANVICDIRESDGVKTRADVGYLPLEVQTSSVGNIDEKWVKKFAWFASGNIHDPPTQDTLKRNASPTSRKFSSSKKPRYADAGTMMEKTASETEAEESEEDSAPQEFDMKLYFPTLKLIIQYLAMNKPGAQFIVFQQSDATKFSKSMLRKYESKGRKLPHTKVILHSPSSPNRTGYMYIGSANFSSSAWGNVSPREEGRVFSMSRNYELGIMFTVKNECAIVGEQKIKLDDILPFKRDTCAGKLKYRDDDVPYRPELVLKELVESGSK